MKKTVLSLTTLAALSTIATGNHADAAAHGRADAVSYSTQSATTAVAPLSTVSNNVFNVTTTSTQTVAAPTATTTESTVQKKPVSASVSVNSNVAAVAMSVAAGKSYVFGANSASAVDCSSFAQQVLAAMGKSIPRTTYSQMAAGTPVSNPEPGDLVFFNGGSHVGVYIGGGQMVDALNPQEGIAQRAVSYVDGSVTGYYRY